MNTPEPTSNHGLVARSAANIGILFVSAPWIRPVTCAEVVAQLMLDIHELNVRKGWWTDMGTGTRAKRNFGELLMLVVSELGEGFAGHYGALMDDKLPARPMLEVELADALIRVFDTAQGTGISLAEALGGFSTDERNMISASNNVAEQLMATVRWLSEVLEADRKRRGDEVKARFLGLAVLQIVSIGLQFGFDVPGAFHDKLVYNLGRQDHDLANRKAGGLKY